MPLPLVSGRQYRVRERQKAGEIVSIEEDLALVVGLSLLIEDRAPEEQRALLRIAYRLDKDRNKDTVPHRPVVPPSALYLDVLATYRSSEGRRVGTLGAKVDKYYEDRKLGAVS